MSNALAPRHSPRPPTVDWTEGWWYGLPVARWFEGKRARRRLRGEAWLLAPVSAALIPLSTSAAEIAFGLCALFWYIGGIREYGRSLLWDSPVARAALLLFGWMALAILWSPEPVVEGLRLLVKYRSLVYVAVLLSLFEDQRLRRATSNAFIGAMLVTLAASWLMSYGLLESKWGTAENCAYFKNHISQNVMMAFAAFLLARSAVVHRRWRAVKIALALLCVHNVLFMVDGRTGYVVFATVVLAFAHAQIGWRGVAAGAFGLLVAGGLVYQFSDGFRSRIDLAFEQLEDYRRGKPVDEMSSIGQRLQFYGTSLAVAAERPFLGHGTGAFSEAYRREAVSRGIEPTHNPHNEYLMVLVQSGVVGVLLLVNLFVVQWRAAADLPEARRTVGRALVLAVAVGCLFNSFLMDKTESSFFTLFTAMCFAIPVGADKNAEAAKADGEATEPMAAAAA